MNKSLPLKKEVWNLVIGSSVSKKSLEEADTFFHLAEISLGKADKNSKRAKEIISHINSSANAFCSWLDARSLEDYASLEKGADSSNAHQFQLKSINFRALLLSNLIGMTPISNEELEPKVFMPRFDLYFKLLCQNCMQDERLNRCKEDMAKVVVRDMINGSNTILYKLLGIIMLAVLIQTESISIEVIEKMDFNKVKKTLEENRWKINDTLTKVLSISPDQLQAIIDFLSKQSTVS